MAKEYKVITQKKRIEEVHLISKVIENDLYSIEKKQLWREGDIYVNLDKEDYENFCKNPKEFNINKWCLDIDALYDACDDVYIICKNGKEIHDGEIVDEIMMIISEEGMDNLEDEHGWDYMDREYLIHGEIELDEV